MNTDYKTLTPYSLSSIVIAVLLKEYNTSCIKNDFLNVIIGSAIYYDCKVGSKNVWGGDQKRHCGNEA